MNYHEYLKIVKAVDLLREHRHMVSLKAITSVNQASSASWRLFTKYSVTGLPNTKQIGESTAEDLLVTINPCGIRDSDLEPFMETAELLVEAILGPE